MVEELNNKQQLFEFFEKNIRNKEIKNFEIPTILAQYIEDEEIVKNILNYCYEDIKNIIETYLDLEEKHYNLISLWIIGTYFHSKFNTYPYL